MIATTSPTIRAKHAGLDGFAKSGFLDARKPNRFRAFQEFVVSRSSGVSGSTQSAIGFSDDRERVRQAADIADVIGSCLPLSRSGRGFVASCPWHDDQRPSLQVNQQRQSWKCWVCNIGGDVFSFVMRRESVEFREALVLLAARYNIPLTQPTSGPFKTSESSDDKASLYRAMSWLEQLLHEQLLRSDAAEPARRYLEERSISSESTQKFRLGFSPREWTFVLDRGRKEGFTPELLEACGMLSKSQTGERLYDRFRGRLMFPIHDAQGRCIAFGGRILPEWAEDSPAKYINSPETRLFTKSDHLYGLDRAKDTIAKSRSITVVEGYTDVIMCHQFGVQDVVAALGTALGLKHLAQLRRYADRVVLVLDGDEAGRKRTNEVLEWFVAADMNLRVMTPPDQLDPCDFLLERGAAEFQALVDAAPDALEHRVRAAMEGIDLANDTHGAFLALEEILATFAKVPRASMLGEDAQRMRHQQMLGRLARLFAVPENDVRERLKGLRAKIENSSPRATSSGTDRPESYRIEDLSPMERDLLALLTQQPDIAPTALLELADDVFKHNGARAIFATYRSLEESGQSVEFPRVLSSLSSESLQCLFIDLEEVGAQKAPKSLIDPATLLRELIASIHEKMERRSQEEALARVSSSSEADLAEQGRLLNEMLNARRKSVKPSKPPSGSHRS